MLNIILKITIIFSGGKMANQYNKVQLFIEDDFSVDETIFTEPLSIAVVDSLKNILPIDSESIDLLIDKIQMCF